MQIFQAQPYQTDFFVFEIFYSHANFSLIFLSLAQAEGKVKILLQ